ncbi:MAG: PQQ-dependent sugar dehydrogenase [Cyclobacteriaceae bacterium]|nr:PQQ-dependent sugar dehydrogenase [Cyclobacteriaceae bacterium]
MAFITEQQALITEKNGDLLKVNLKSASRTPINGLPSDLVDSIGVHDSRDNSGLFEVLLDPEFSENNLIYLSYSAQGDSGTTTKVIRAQLQDNELSNLETLLVGNPYNQELFHYGGGMTFGVDGKLYVTIDERYYREDRPTKPSDFPKPGGCPGKNLPH